MPNYYRINVDKITRLFVIIVLLIGIIFALSCGYNFISNKIFVQQTTNLPVIDIPPSIEFTPISAQTLNGHYEVLSDDGRIFVFTSFDLWNEVMMHRRYIADIAGITSSGEYIISAIHPYPIADYDIHHHGSDINPIDYISYWYWQGQNYLWDGHKLYNIDVKREADRRIANYYRRR